MYFLWEHGEIIESSEQRCFTFNEIDALVRASGCFEIVDILGSLKPNVKFIMIRNAGELNTFWICNESTVSCGNFICGLSWLVLE